MTLPAPTGLRLVGATRAKPPLGVKAWTDDAGAIAIAVEGPDDVASIARQIPDASTLPAGTLVVVLGEPSGAGGFLARFRRGATLSRATRGSALLARGYVRSGAGVDATGADLAWAWST